MVEAKMKQEDREAEDDVHKGSKKVKLETPTIDDELKTKITKQIEYYFSDVNLVKDKFMQEQLANNDNSVKLSVLATFSRLAQLTKDENLLVAALKDYKSSIMELDEENKLVRRIKPLPDKQEFQKQLDLRTVHISGFPDSVEFDVLGNFCSQYGKVESLSMRRHFRTRQFKGCIHVVFESEVDAKKVLESKPLTFKDRELRLESMEDYHKRKESMLRSRKASKQAKTSGDKEKKIKEEESSSSVLAKD